MIFNNKRIHEVLCRLPEIVGTPKAAWSLVLFGSLAITGCSGVEATDESLKWAIVHHDVAKVRAILKKKPELAKTPEHLWNTAVSHAKGRTEILGLLLDAGADPNTKNGAPLGMAVGFKDLEVCRFLLDRGADPNSKNQNGTTILMDANFLGDVQIIELLLSRGADVNAVDAGGWTVLDKNDFGRNSEEIAKVLLKYGAKRNQPNPNERR